VRARRRRGCKRRFRLCPSPQRPPCGAQAAQRVCIAWLQPQCLLHVCARACAVRSRQCVWFEHVLRTRSWCVLVHVCVRAPAQGTARLHLLCWCARAPGSVLRIPALLAPAINARGQLHIHSPGSTPQHSPGSTPQCTHPVALHSVCVVASFTRKVSQAPPGRRIRGLHTQAGKQAGARCKVSTASSAPLVHSHCYLE